MSIFQKIIDKEIPADIVFENENVLAFKDINPQAKEHYLFIHKTPTTNVNHMMDNQPAQIAEIFSAINEFTSSNDLAKNGFRVVTNLGEHGCQTVFHTHFHVLGGQRLKGGFGA